LAKLKEKGQPTRSQRKEGRIDFRERAKIEKRGKKEGAKLPAHLRKSLII